MLKYLPSPKFARAVLVLGGLILAGCGGHYVNRGADLYADGRYVEAAEIFERTQQRLPSSNAPERARYGLYRGATLFVLGDFAHAQSWLTYAYDIERAHPGTLASDERAFLDRVWLALEARFRHLPTGTPDSAVAASQHPPAPAADTVPAPAAPLEPGQTPVQRSLVAP